MHPPARTPLGRLLRRLELEAREKDVFLGDPGRGEGRLFGGLVAAQAVMAASRTVEDASLHSLHAYFLRPGRHGEPIRYAVQRLRDGRSFTTRSVVAEQAGETIFELAASFTRGEPGISHQDPMPEAPPPEGLEDWEDLRARILGDPRARRPGAVEVRVVDPDSARPGEALPPWKRVWIRPAGPVPVDPRLHTALVVFASDRTLLSTAARPHGLPWGRRRAASLDHALWLHRAPRFDDWHLYVSRSPVAHQARGLVLGALYARDGTRVATVAQEGLIRVGPSAGGRLG
jgi:acyl-CoA thioesterase-2